MANIRLSNTGGTFATGATWDGGVAPGATDTWYADSSSGNLTLGANAQTRAYDFTGYTGTLDLVSFTLTAAVATGSTSNVKLATGMTVSYTTGLLVFHGVSATVNFYPCGKTTPRLTLGQTGLNTATLTLQGALTVAGALTVVGGTFNANGYSVTLSGALSSSNANTRSITLADVALTGTGTVWTTSDPTGLTLACSGTISVTNTSSTDKTIIANGVNLGNVSVIGGGTGQIKITSDAVVNNLVFSHPKTVVVSGGKTLTISGTVGSNGTSAPSRVVLQSSTTGTPFTISKASGEVSIDWWSLKDSTASGGANFYAGANSLNVSGNSRWTFSAPPGALPMNLLLDTDMYGGIAE